MQKRARVTADGGAGLRGTLVPVPLPKRLAPLVVGALLAGLGVGPAVGPARAAAPAWHTWTGTPTDVFRTGTYSGHEYVRTGALFDALGANTDALERRDYYRAVLTPSTADPTLASRDLYNALTYDFFGAHRATHNGDFLLPADPARFPDGTAEVTEVRLAVEGDQLYVRLRWNAMPRPDAQIATLTFAGAQQAAQERAWPSDAGLTGTYATALTLWGTGASIADGPDAATPLPPGSVRTGDHVTEARVPLSALPAGPWTVNGGSGLHDVASPGRYLSVPAGQPTATSPGSGGPLAPTNVWQLLFDREDLATLDELEQSRSLAAGTSAGHDVVVDPAVLRAGTGRATPPPTGDFSRMLRSRLFQSDGIRKTGAGSAPITQPFPVPVSLANPGLNVSYFYTGRQQRYDMHVPARYPAGTASWPLIVYLHGFTGLPEEPFRNPVGLVQEADRQGYLLASALGRGDYFYRGEGDLDVLEVIADVSRRYRVDPDRIYLMGHSMGGYGSNNLAAHHPDLFAATAPAQGTDSIDLAGNLRHVPWYETTSEEDLDTFAADAKTLYGALSDRGYDATLLDYSLKIHEYSSIFDGLPRLFRFFAAHRRVTDPAVVTWVRKTADDRPDLGLVYDGAYWVDEVRATDPAVVGEVTVQTQMRVGGALDPAAASRTDERVDEGGPTMRTAAQLLQTVPAAAPALPAANTLRLDAKGVSALTVDATRAKLQLRAGVPLTVAATTDAAVTVTFTRLPAGIYSRTVDGAAAGTVRGSTRALAVALPAGGHSVVLSLAGRAPATRAMLPATGPGAPSLLLVLVVAAGGALHLVRRNTGL